MVVLVQDEWLSESKQGRKEDMSPLAYILGGVFVLACAVTGSLVLLHRAQRIGQFEREYGIVTPRLREIASALGAAAGLGIGFIVLYFASQTSRINAIEWVGRGSYLLVTGATAGHLLILIRTALHLQTEETAWRSKGDMPHNTLSFQRMRALARFRRHHRHYVDLKMRDDRALETLVGVLGTPLLNSRNDLSRIPFYGYLGTVCGILLMAQQLGYINEATETFKVLSSMANGLVLAFQTTLVALLAFLPLRKATDYLIRRLGRLEDMWTTARDERAEET